MDAPLVFDRSYFIVRCKISRISFPNGFMYFRYLPRFQVYIVLYRFLRQKRFATLGSLGQLVQFSLNVHRNAHS